MNSPSFLAASLYVVAGGGTGAWLRYLAGRAFPPGGFPYATLGVNLLGSFAMGLLAGWLAHNGSESWRLLLGVGVLGGFTPFRPSASKSSRWRSAARSGWRRSISPYRWPAASPASWPAWQ